MPRRNSTNVPRIIGKSSFEMYARTNLTSFLYFSSPSQLMNDSLGSSLAMRYAVRPFSANP